MAVFHGHWNEDPREFLNSYLQCTLTGSNSFRARHFINYLGVYSEAEDWFYELPQEEKMDWEAIEIAFRKQWLKEEVLSIKETAIENEPQPESTSHTPPSAFSTPVSTHEHTEHAAFENATHIFVNSSSSPKLTVNETSANLGGYIEFSPTPAVSELVASSSITSAFETRQITADFTQNDSKIENLLILTQTTPISLSPSIPEPTNHATRVNRPQTRLF
jgi:hypothetical protein